MTEEQGEAIARYVELSLPMARARDSVATGSASFAVDELASLGAVVAPRRG